MAITSFRGEYRFLSNFYESPMLINHKRIKTVEHAFQAAKTLNPLEQIAVLSAPSPGVAKRLGRTVTLRSDWEERKVRVMRKLLFAKFSQNPELAVALMLTGEQELVEGNTRGDHFWGVCRGTGENMLGQLLMEVRKNLRQVLANALP